MVANSNYKGLLAIENRWALSIVLKHAAIGVMVVLATIQTWFLQPQVLRLTILLSKEKTRPDVVTRLLLRATRLRRFNFLLGLVVLALTAIARTS
jgi:hypothetical protein